MTDVSKLDDLANLISNASPNIKKYAQAQAAATQKQEEEIRWLRQEVEVLKAKGGNGGSGGSGGGGTAPNLGTSLHTRLGVSSAGAVYYVSNSGDDSRSAVQAQNPATPWQTINHAITQVGNTPGAIIELANGTYQSVGGTYVILISGKTVTGGSTNPITIRAANPGGAVISGSVMGGVFTIGAFIVNSTGYRLEGLRFSVQGLNSVGVQIENSTWIELNKCIFNDTGEIAVKTRGAPGTPSTDIGIWNCLFAPSGTKVWQRVGAQWVNDPVNAEFVSGLDTGNSGGTLPNGSGYYGTKGSHCMYVGQVSGAETGQGGGLRTTIANCIFAGSTPGRHMELGPQAVDTHVVNCTFYGNQPTFYYNTDLLPNFHSGLAGSAIEFFGNVAAYATRGTRVVNCIFHSMQGHAGYGSAGFNLTGNQMFNNLAFNLQNGWDGTTSYQENRLLDYHTTWGSSTLFSTPAPGNRPNANPLLTSPQKNESGNFRPQAGSPAKAVAMPEWTPKTDYFGVSRPALPTLGAIEAA